VSGAITALAAIDTLEPGNRSCHRQQRLRKGADAGERGLLYLDRAMPAIPLAGPHSVTDVLTNVVDYGMDVQQALDLPRGFHYDGVYQLEAGISHSAISGLQRLGHVVARPREPHGGGQVIWINCERGVGRRIRSAQSWLRPRILMPRQLLQSSERHRTIRYRCPLAAAKPSLQLLIALTS